MTDKEHIFKLRATLQGVQQYVINSNPRSLRGEDQEAKVLAVIAIEAALALGDNDPSIAAKEAPAVIEHPLNPKMGNLIHDIPDGEQAVTA